MMYSYDLNDPKYKNDINKFIKHNPLVKKHRKISLLKCYCLFLITFLLEYLFSFFFWKDGYAEILLTFFVIFILIPIIAPKRIFNNMIRSITLDDTASIEVNDNNFFYISNDRKINLKNDTNTNIITFSKLDLSIIIFLTLKDMDKIEYKLVLIPLDFFKTSKEVELFQESLLDK